MKTRQFHDPVLGARVFLIINCSVEEASEVLGKKKGIEFEATTTMDGGVFNWITESKKGNYKEFAIWLQNKTDISCIAHESLHLTHRVFESRGIPFNETNTEFMAYYMEYWINEIIGVYVKKEKRKGVKN